MEVILVLNVLAIDLGASSGRVMRGAFDGKAIELEEIRRFANHPLSMSDGIFWNVYFLFQEVKWGIAEAARRYASMASLAVDGWAVDFGLLDTGGQLIGLPRHYRDKRNIAAMNEIVHRLGKGQLFERTGIQINPINTLYQLYAMLQDGDTILSAADRLLMIPDLLNYFLSGVKVSEFTNATTTQFLTLAGDWDTELLKQLHLPVHLLPQITYPGTIVGSLVDDELSMLHSGLSSLKIVQTTSHDTASAVVSVPYTDPHFVYISSGTWSLMGTVVDSPLVTDQTRAFNLSNEGGLGNYRLLKNVMGLWLIQETQKVLRALNEPFQIDYLIQLAESAGPFTYVFNPDDTRLLQPVNLPEVIRQICRETGQSEPRDTATLVRGIFESLALKYRQVLEELELVTGRHYPTIHVVGGGAQNKLLSQFTANACQRVVVTGPVEASTMGNVMVQLLALGEVTSSADIIQVIQNSVTPLSYLPGEGESWDRAFERFQAVSDMQAEMSTSI